MANSTEFVSVSYIDFSKERLNGQVCFRFNAKIDHLPRFYSRSPLSAEADLGFTLLDWDPRCECYLGLLQKQENKKTRKHGCSAALRTGILSHTGTR